MKNVLKGAILNLLILHLRSFAKDASTGESASYFVRPRSFAPIKST